MRLAEKMVGAWFTGMVVRKGACFTGVMVRRDLPYRGDGSQGDLSAWLAERGVGPRTRLGAAVSAGGGGGVFLEDLFLVFGPGFGWALYSNFF